MHLQRQPYFSVYPAVPYRPKFKAVDSLLINMPGYKQNQAWDAEMKRAIEAAKNRLRQGSFSNCKSLFRFLADAHGVYIRSHPGADFNCSRLYNLRPETQALFTQARVTEERVRLSIAGRYKPYLPRVFTLLGISELDQGRYVVHEMSYQKSGVQPIPLTKTMWGRGKLLWQHPSIRDMDRAIQEAESYFKTLQAYRNSSQNPENLQNILKNVAAIHWLYVHAVPVLRGTAATTDMLTKVLLDMLDIDVPKWKEGLAPDLEALVTPFEQYVENYPNFFVRRPRYNQA